NIIQKAVDEAINLGKPWNVKAQLRKQDGNVIWVNTIGRPKFKDGKCIRVIGTIQEVDEENQIDIQLSKLEDELNEYPLFEKIPHGLAIVDYETGRFINVNHQFLKLSGFDKNTFLNKSFKKFVNTSFIGKLESIVHQLEENGAFKPVKFTFTNKLKHQLNLKVTGNL
ncbi:unnamed protein product, partial [Ectocarpus sp. 12 AP-2014]